MDAVKYYLLIGVIYAVISEIRNSYYSLRNLLEPSEAEWFNKIPLIERLNNFLVDIILWFAFLIFDVTRIPIIIICEEDSIK